MTKNTRLKTTVVILLLLAALAIGFTGFGNLFTDQAATQNSKTADSLVISGAWIREAPPTRNVTAAYLVIENKSTTETTLVGATTEIASPVEMHKMENDGNFMRMKKVEGIKLPPNSKTEILGPQHIMLFNLKGPLQQGQEIPITLEFTNGVKKTVTFTVKKPQG